MFLSKALFVSILLGTCLVLGAVVLPGVTDAKLPGQEVSRSGDYARQNHAGDVDAQIREAEAKTRTHGNTISLTGVGRVTEDTTQSKLLGRRAAITDARRKLLIQRQRLLGDPNYNASSVSGYLGGTQRIKSEALRNGTYFVEIEMSIEELMHSKFDEDRFSREMDDL